MFDLIEGATLDRWVADFGLRRVLVKVNVFQRFRAIYRPYPCHLWVPPPPGFRWETDTEIRKRVCELIEQQNRESERRYYDGFRSKNLHRP
jgi:hypothetical protein